VNKKMPRHNTYKTVDTDTFVLLKVIKKLTRKHKSNTPFVLGPKGKQ
jgi:hypothetical protein